MTQTSATMPAQARSLSPLMAWRNVLGVTLVGWIVIAVPNFAFFTNVLARTMQHNLVLASLYLDLGFLVSCILAIGLVFWWQRAHGETLADLGWRKPTTITSLVVAVIFGALWITTSYFNTPTAPGFLSFSWERLIMAPVGIILALGEELLFRGFLMEQLRRARVATWLQILVSGAAIGSYHGLVGFGYYPVYAISAFVLFSIVALIHVLGKRSMTPNLTAHAMTHVFGDPALTMGILVGALHHIK